LDESFHLGGAQLMNQRVGEGYLQYTTTRPPIQIKTFLPKRLRAETQALREYTAEIFERMGALPPAAARRLIEERRQRLLNGDPKPGLSSEVKPGMVVPGPSPLHPLHNLKNQPEKKD